MTYTCGVCAEALTLDTVSEHLLGHEPNLVGVQIDPTGEVTGECWPVPLPPNYGQTADDE